MKSSWSKVLQKKHFLYWSVYFYTKITKISYICTHLKSFCWLKNRFLWMQHHHSNWCLMSRRLNIGKAERLGSKIKKEEMCLHCSCLKQTVINEMFAGWTLPAHYAVNHRVAFVMGVRLPFPAGDAMTRMKHELLLKINLVV